jgi:hypothetical protein
VALNHSTPRVRLHPRLLPVPVHPASVSGFMRTKQVLLAAACAAILVSVSGCAVVSIATTTASVAGTAISVGVTAGSMAVGAATTAAKGAVSVGSAVLGGDDDD